MAETSYKIQAIYWAGRKSCLETSAVLLSILSGVKPTTQNDITNLDIVITKCCKKFIVQKIKLCTHFKLYGMLRIKNNSSCFTGSLIDNFSWSNVAKPIHILAKTETLSKIG